MGTRHKPVTPFNPQCSPRPLSPSHSSVANLFHLNVPISSPRRIILHDPTVWCTTTSRPQTCLRVLTSMKMVPMVVEAGYWDRSPFLQMKLGCDVFSMFMGIPAEGLQSPARWCINSSLIHLELSRKFQGWERRSAC